METLVNHLHTMVGNKDATLAPGQDGLEMETVLSNFAEKKLGISDKERAMGAIHKVAEKISVIRMKSISAFYYSVK